METLQRTANRGSVSSALYSVANSVKLQTAGVNSEFFNYTISSAGSRTTGTVSMWIKRSSLGTLQYLWEQGDTDNDNGRIFARFGTDDTLRVAGGSTVFLNTNRVFRDTSAWMHIVVAIDTTSGTADNRARIYVNGVEETSFSTRNNFSQNDNTGMNFEKQFIGLSIADESSFQSFNGYMCEVVIQDGVASAPTEFGEFDSATGIWIPKDASGATMGTNGSYLKFENASSMGAASAGHAFSVQNINQNDQATDTCTNNFATFNPLLLDTSENQGATVFINPDAGADTNLSTIAVANGKWYAEFKASSNISGGNGMVGVSANSGDSMAGRFLGQDAWSVGLISDSGEVRINNSGTSYLGSAFNQDLISVALDMDNKKVYFALNGTYGNSGNPATGTNGIALPSAYQNLEFFIGTSLVLNTATYDANYGGYTVISISSGNTDSNGYGNFEYAVPSGFFSLNTKNLAEHG
jgi:hypothetical protein